MDMQNSAASASTDDLMGTARRVAGLLTGCAARIDADRELPPEALEAMHEAGLFRLLLPRSVGGAELEPVIYNQVVEIIASGDASAAWCMNQNTGCSMSAAYLAPDVAWKIFGADFPRSVAEITDVWQVMGLRGTGSDSYAVRDLFVPADHALARDTDEERRESGKLYRFTTGHIYASGFAAVALGVARATLDNFIALARDKTPALSQSSLRDNNVVQAKVALGEATLRSARAWLHQVLRDAWTEAEAAGALSLNTRMAIRLASTYAIQQARQVVDMAYHEAGATAIFDSQPFERRFRDMNAVTQQVQGRHTHFETVGQWMLGAAPHMRWI
jgi:alkylation response protein AidB-like acyl-CoA dehydrogenase